MPEFPYRCHKCGNLIYVEKPLGIIEFRCPRIVRKERNKLFVWTSAWHDRWDKCNAKLSVEDRL